MGDHYFSQKPTSQSNPTQFQATIHSITLQFHTDEGVFSKKQIDFGTRSLIEAFKQPDIHGDLLDLGCGYGPIGITLAKTYPERNVVMVDINERAVELAQKNLVENGIKNCEAIQSDGIDKISERTFAAVITNPPFRAGKKLVHRMIEDSFRVLKHGGELWLVVQKKQGAPSLRDKINEVFGYVETVNRNKGYYILCGKKE